LKSFVEQRIAVDEQPGNMEGMKKPPFYKQHGKVVKKESQNYKKDLFSAMTSRVLR
jgi:hypothetical protein